MIVTGADITAWVGSYIWPLFRVGGLVMTAPVFGAKPLPVRIRLALAVAITLVIAPIVSPSVPRIDALSPDAILVTIQQVLIGVVMGFSLQLVISAIITGGQAIALQMGLGFSLMVDPQNGTQAPVLSQFYILMVLLTFLALDGHLVLIEILAESFRTIPIATHGMTADSLWQLVNWGSQIFAGAVGMALPAIASLLVVNVAFGIMTRAAPQLNIFAIGFPVTMILGFAVILVTLSSVIPHSGELFNHSYHLIQQILGIRES